MELIEKSTYIRNDKAALLTLCIIFQEVLQEMYAEGISPSVNTFNIILRAISNSKDKQFSMQVINEMRMCGIGKCHHFYQF